MLTPKNHPLMAFCLLASSWLFCSSYNVPTVSELSTVLSTTCENAPFLECGGQLILDSSTHPFGTGLDCLTQNPENPPVEADFSNAVWFKIQGTGEIVVISTCGGEFYFQEIHVYEGACGNFTCHAPAADTGCDNGAPRYTLSTTLGTVYTVMIGVFSATTVEGELQIDIQCGNCNDRGNLTLTPPQNFVDMDMKQFTTNGTITADNILYAGSDIIYNAALGIDLNEKFEVKNEGEFQALVEGCP